MRALRTLTYILRLSAHVQATSDSGGFEKRKNVKEHMNGENGRKIPKVLYSFGRRARVEQRAISKEKWIFFPAGLGPAFSPKIRLIGSLQPLRSETPESVRVTVCVKLDGGCLSGMDLLYGRAAGK